MRSRGTATLAVISTVATATFLATTFLATTLLPTPAAWAQTAPPKAGGPPLRVVAAKAVTGPNDRQVYLVRQDSSDCTNTTVPSGDSPNVGGNLWLTRDPATGNTTVKIAMTASPDTAYNFYLKCVKQLGTITTGDEGEGFAEFTFPTNSVGATYGFDMYPNGAPSGNKFQSATVNF
jgi:hypothetical protein